MPLFQRFRGPRGDAPTTPTQTPPSAAPRAAERAQRQHVSDRSQILRPQAQRPPAAQPPRRQPEAAPLEQGARRQAEPAGLRRYLALAPRPTEPLLAQELHALKGVHDVEELSGAVAFRGDQETLYRANLWLRCATRVLMPLSDVPCDGPNDLYEAAAAIPWEQYLGQAGTLMVSAHGQGPGLTNSVFAAQRVKDAIVDRFRSRTGSRPSVDLRQPDLRINVHLYHRGPVGPAGAQGAVAQGEQALVGRTRCAIALDSSGAALHQRGYRQGGGIAPMKETLAAAIVAYAGYGDEPLEGGAPRPVVDLCCGSGTLLIEAGLRALKRAPGLTRTFGLQRWRDHDRALWGRLVSEAKAAAAALPAEPFLFGGDLSAEAVQMAARNGEAAGLSPWLRLQAQDLAEAAPPPGPPGIVLCNPPYGERLGAEEALAGLYTALGNTLKRRFTGYTAYVFTANLPLGRLIGLRPKSRQLLFNGNLEGRLLRFDLY